jgi:hypothetical protein
MLESAPCHCAQINKPLTFTSRRRDIQEWLQKLCNLWRENNKLHQIVHTQGGLNNDVVFVQLEHC